jgi:site-specific DNA-methyltransferase (adenine-specific)
MLDDMLARMLNQIHHGDCIAGMNGMPEGSVDLVFADPPFNIGYEYDVYEDSRSRHEYLDWSRAWIAAAHRVLKDDGTFWLAIGDDYAAELKLLSQEVGFHCRSWVIWYYTFGVNCKAKFSRSHTHLLYFVKNPAKFTFRADLLENRIPSARQLVYADKRANSIGRLPDDTWILRPQDLEGCFSADEDTWYFPRVAGTFKERAGFHGCQMPEQLLGRIIRFCSNEGETVLDPFSGSATTLTVAKKLGRRFLGFDLSLEYVQRGRDRLANFQVGDPLAGAAEPTASAPATPGKRASKARPTTIANTKAATKTPALSAELPFENELIDAFANTSQSFSPASLR